MGATSTVADLEGHMGIGRVYGGVPFKSSIVVSLKDSGMKGSSMYDNHRDNARIKGSNIILLKIVM